MIKVKVIGRELTVPKNELLIMSDAQYKLRDHAVTPLGDGLYRAEQRLYFCKGEELHVNLNRINLQNVLVIREEKESLKKDSCKQQADTKKKRTTRK